jgi:hypothetical protein
MSTVPATNPGVQVFIKDGYKLPANNAPYAERMVLIAKHGADAASNIADLLYTPVAYTSVDDVVAAYGLNSPAANAFIQAYGAGGANIFICATPHAAATVPAEFTNTYSPDEYEVHQALEHCDIATPDMIVIFGYEINKEYTVNAIERVSKIAKLAVDQCEAFGAEGFPCFALVHPAAPTGTDAITSAVTLDDYLTKTYETAPAGYATLDDVVATCGKASDGEDLSKYLVCVLGEIEMLDQPDVYTVDGNGVRTRTPGFNPAVAAVAGSLYVNGLDSAITMRRIARVRNVRYNFSKKQRVKIMSNRCVPVALDTRGYAVTVDGVTLAQPDVSNNESMYARISNLRLAFEVIKASRRIVEPVIGQPAANHVMDSIQTLLGNYYGTLKNKGLVYDIGFNFDYYAETYTLVININLVPMGEIRTIELRVGISMR